MWQGKIPSAAKAALQMRCLGAAEAAPLQNNDFFSSSEGHFAVVEFLQFSAGGR
jgi:hypothetical protein